MFLFAFFAIVLAGTAVTLAARAGALPRVQAARRLDQIAAYGAANRPAGPEHGSDHAPFDGLASRIGSFVARVAGAKTDGLRSELMAAGVYRITPTALVGYRAVAAAGLPVLALFLAPAAWPLPARLAVAALGCWCGWVLPVVVLQRRARKRLQEIDFALPGMIDLLVVTVEAGLGFSSALKAAADKLQGPLGDELRLTMQEQQMGLATRDALKNMAGRADTAGMRTFVRAVVQGEQLGVSIGQILRGLAVEMRLLRKAMAEERAHKAPVKMLFPLVFLIFPAMFILLLGPAVLDVMQGFSEMG